MEVVLHGWAADELAYTNFHMIPVAGISDIYESVNVVFCGFGGNVSIEYGSLCGQVEYTVYISVFEDVANACVCCTTSLKEEYFFRTVSIKLLKLSFVGYSDKKNLSEKF